MSILSSAGVNALQATGNYAGEAQSEDNHEPRSLRRLETASWQTAVGELCSSVDIIKGQMSRSQSVQDKLEQNIKDLNSLYGKIDVERTRWNRELDELRSAVRDLQQPAQGALHDVCSEYARALRSERKAIQEEIERSVIARTLAESKAACVNMLKGESEQHSTELSNFGTRLASVEAQLSSEETERCKHIAEIRTELRDSQHSVSNAKQYASFSHEMSRFRIRLKELGSTVEEMQNELRDQSSGLESNANQCMAVCDEVEDFRRSLTELGSQVDAKMAAVLDSQLECKLSPAEGCQKRSCVSSNAVAALVNRIDVLEDVITRQEKRTARQEIRPEVTETVSSLASTVLSLEKKVDSALGAGVGASLDIQEPIRALENRFAVLEDTVINDCIERLNSKESEATTRSHAVRALEDRLDVLEARVAETTTRSRGIRALEDRFDVLEDRVTEKSQASRVLEDRFDTLEDRVAERSQASRTLEDRLDTLEDRVSEASMRSQAIRGLEDRFDAFEARGTKGLGSKDLEITRVQAIRKLEDRFDTLEHKVSDRSHASRHLEDRLHALEDRITKEDAECSGTKVPKGWRTANAEIRSEFADKISGMESKLVSLESKLSCAMPHRHEHRLAAVENDMKSMKARPCSPERSSAFEAFWDRLSSAFEPKLAALEKDVMVARQCCASLPPGCEERLAAIEIDMRTMKDSQSVSSGEFQKVQSTSVSSGELKKVQSALRRDIGNLQASLDEECEEWRKHFEKLRCEQRLTTIERDLKIVMGSMSSEEIQKILSVLRHDIDAARQSLDEESQDWRNQFNKLSDSLETGLRSLMEKIDHSIARFDTGMGEQLLIRNIACSAQEEIQTLPPSSSRKSDVARREEKEPQLLIDGTTNSAATLLANDTDLSSSRLEASEEVAWTLQNLQQHPSRTSGHVHSNVDTLKASQNVECFTFDYGNVEAVAQTEEEVAAASLVPEEEALKRKLNHMTVASKHVQSRKQVAFDGAVKASCGTLPQGQPSPAGLLEAPCGMLSPGQPSPGNLLAQQSARRCQSPPVSAGRILQNTTGTGSAHAPSQMQSQSIVRGPSPRPTVQRDITPPQRPVQRDITPPQRPLLTQRDTTPPLTSQMQSRIVESRSAGQLHGAPLVHAAAVRAPAHSVFSKPMTVRKSSPTRI